MSGLVFVSVPHYQYASLDRHNVEVDHRYIGAIKRTFDYSHDHRQHMSGKFMFSPTGTTVDSETAHEIDRFVAALNVALRLTGKI